MLIFCQCTRKYCFFLHFGVKIAIYDAELIFVTNITNYICGEKNCHVEKFQLSMYDNCGEIEISPHVEKFREILGNFATIYVFSCGEKLSPKVHFVEKK